MNSPNFSEIAARVAAGSADVRACLVVSSDGLTLGVFPEDREEDARAAWGRMVASGDPEPERGFLTVGEETWAFTRRGGYGALAVAGRAVRPGLLLDSLDAALKEAHQERVAISAEGPAASREAVRERRTSEPVRRSRTAAHAEPRRSERRVGARPVTAGPPVRRFDPDALDDLEVEPVEVRTAPAETEDDYESRPEAFEPETAETEPVEPEPSEPEPAEPEPAEPEPEPARPAPVNVDVRVDTAELSREFGGLLDGPGGR